ncbi:putative Synaptobrevin, partial [Operophtera brumata]
EGQYPHGYREVASVMSDSTGYPVTYGLKTTSSEMQRALGTEFAFVNRASEGGLAPGGDGEMPVGGPKTPQQVAAQRRLQQTQAQVDEVVDIMKTNVEKVLERDQKLSELDDRAANYA